MSAPPLPTRGQLRVVEAATRWYLARYFDSPDDPGVTRRFTEPAQVGAFAIAPEQLAAGDNAALFRLLVMTTMFQRRQDQQILRILRGMSPQRAREVTDRDALLRHADACACPHTKTNEALINACDLTKDATRRGACQASPTVPCVLKEHTVWLKRYGHFGKVPTSAALNLRERGHGGLEELYASSLARLRTRDARAIACEEALTSSWRVSAKIACMFLSAISNPDLARGLAPWQRGLEWRRYVVIDSNVDLFLEAIAYRGSNTYEARRAFLREVSRRVDLRSMSRRLHRDNPRVVQQAMYVFMSASNRRAAARDCMHLGPAACRRCPRTLRERCAVRSV
ncbi:MAG: hypothetical protein KC636_28555 [Myxococcales bacterium]|nr:hypothetical protein [Myxococcales bacterium]